MSWSYRSNLLPALNSQTPEEQAPAVFPTAEHCRDVTHLDMLRLILAMASIEDRTQRYVHLVGAYRA